MKSIAPSILVAVTLVAGQAIAAECDTQAVLEHLQAEVVGELNEQQAARAREILASLCAPPKKDDTTELFGIELRPAEEDSKGHERLKRRGH